MKQGARRRTGRNVSEMESAEMSSTSMFADPDNDVCADPNRPGTGDPATCVFE